MSTGTPSQSACMFCLQDTGKLHACLTMNLDYDLWQMATELQDTELLARISGGDLVSNRGQVPFKCFSAYISKYRNVQMK